MEQNENCVFGGHRNADERLVTFRFSRDSSRCAISRALLIEFSEFYKAMFSGSFVEAKLEEFEVRDTADYTSDAFKTFLHFVEGCRNCSQAPIRYPADAVSLLHLADKHNAAELMNMSIEESWKLMTSDSLGIFLSVSILMRQARLFDVCILFMIFHCDSATRTKTLTLLVQRNLLADFCDLFQRRLANVL